MKIHVPLIGIGLYVAFFARGVFLDGEPIFVSLIAAAVATGVLVGIYLAGAGLYRRVTA